jgi:CheY-like chemotaxis protein/two-component sensor histidine kinase
VGNLAGGIAHDFNNLLQAISGYTQLLLKHCQDQAQIKRLAGIEKSIHRAAGLVRQLLTFSRKIESHLEPLNLNREIRQIRSILARTLPKMVAIRLDLEPDLRLINGDPIQLEQVLLNLAINANHAMPEGGALTITTANVDLDKVFVSAHLGTKEGANVMLRVADTGVGMDAQTVERIFEPFFTTKETGKGTGLGLATVYGIVREHGACITCDSAIGQGTVFTLYFPALEESAQAAVNKPMGTVEDLPAGGAETVLLVDDEPMILDIGSEMLRQHGYTILTASSGEEALQRYQRYREEIAVVVLDLNMPGMGGFKCLEQLKRMDDRVLVLVASGFVPAESVQRATNLGADGFLPKPFKLQELMQSIRAVLDRKDRLPTGS